MHLSKHRYHKSRRPTCLPGRLPLRSPYEFCGVPLRGTSQGAALYGRWCGG